MAYAIPIASTPIFTGSAAKTVANSSAETSAIPTGVGSLTLPANFWMVGRTIRLTGGGVYSSLLTPGNLTCRIKLGSTTVASVTVTALLGAASNSGFDFEATICCRSTGASGTVVSTGQISYGLSATTRGISDINTGTSTVTIDTTASMLLDVTVQWATASASNTMTAMVAVVENVN